jgi:transcriptional regulator with XRE-family HTH domain
MPDHAAKLRRRFGATLRQQRTQRKLTQQEVAFAAELSLTYVGEIERGNRMASLYSVERIARALGLSAGEMLTLAGI